MIGYFDMHCHIIPGVDDGSRDIDMSMAILKKEYKDGVRNIILTPHFRRRMFETPGHKIKEKYELLREKAAAVWPDLHLYLGCEFHSNMDLAELVEKDERFRMAGSDFLLLEFSSRHTATDIRERTYETLSCGLTPIIAHVERYDPIYENLDFAEELIHMGARLQVNADSIIGNDGRQVKKFCKNLMKYDMLSFVGSDAHDLSSRACHIGECARYIEKKMGKAYAEEILIDNPSEILASARKRRRAMEE